VALRLLPTSSMAEPTEPEEQVTKKVTYEHTASSGTWKQNLVVIIVLVVIALALIGYIVMHMHR
jgi:hypothetical protein